MSFMRIGRSALSLIPHRCYSVRSSSSSSSIARGFEWRKLVCPHTSPQAIEAFKEIETSVAKLAADVAATPAAPEAINWDQWAKTIKTPGAVAELRKQYEATLASITEAEKASASQMPAEIVEFNTELDQIISKAESIAKVSEEEALKLKAVVKDLEEWDQEIGDGIVPLFEYYDKNPGMKEQLMAEYENGEFLPTDAETRLAATDIAALQQVLKNGGEAEPGGILPADRFGDYKPTQAPQEMKDWLKRVYGEISDESDELNFEFDLDPYADESGNDHH